MILYHGSDTAVEKPRILESNRFLDFGVGFYTTKNLEQAERWAGKVCLRNNSSKSIISMYRCDFHELKLKLNVIEFTDADEPWLDFVVDNRRGVRPLKRFDLVAGPVADDSVYLTIKLFENGVLDKEETIKRLKVEKWYNQVSFLTEAALEFCIFDHEYELSRLSNG